MKNAIRKFFKKPKNIAIILFGLLFLYALHYQPELLGGLIAIIILVAVIYFMARPIFRKLFK